MVDYLKQHIDQDTFDSLPIEEVMNLLDMGTGTGFIALSVHIIKTLLPKFKPNIYASDILKEAIIISKRNARINNAENDISFIHSDLFKSFPESLKHRFNIIIFNPPYLPSINGSHHREDYSWDGGNEGTEVFIRFLDEASEFLSVDAPCFIYYLCSSHANLEKLYQSIREKGFKNKILEKRHVFMEDLYLNRIEK